MMSRRLDIRSYFIFVYVYSYYYNHDAGNPALDHHNGGGCPPHPGRWRLPSKRTHFAKEVVTMIDVNTVIALIMLALTAVGLGIQIASYINSKNDRPSDKL